MDKLGIFLTEESARCCITPHNWVAVFSIQTQLFSFLIHSLNLLKNSFLYFYIEAVWTNQTFEKELLLRIGYRLLMKSEATQESIAKQMDTISHHGAAAVLSLLCGVKWR